MKYTYIIMLFHNMFGNCPNCGKLFLITKISNIIDYVYFYICKLVN